MVAERNLDPWNGKKVETKPYGGNVPIPAPCGGDNFQPCEVEKIRYQPRVVGTIPALCGGDTQWTIPATCGGDNSSPVRWRRPDSSPMWWRLFQPCVVETSRCQPCGGNEPIPAHGLLTQVLRCFPRSQKHFSEFYIWHRRRFRAIRTLLLDRGVS